MGGVEGHDGGCGSAKRRAHLQDQGEPFNDANVVPDTRQCQPAISVAPQARGWHEAVRFDAPSRARK